MKYIKSILLFWLSFIIICCGKDDAPTTVGPDPIGQPDPEPQPENRPPGAFSLLEVQDNAKDVDAFPTFIWEAATDPDGDQVNYDLFIGSSPDSLDNVAEDLDTTSYSLNDRLLLNSVYYWQVVAKDGRGMETSGELYSFTTRDIIIPNTPITTNLGFSSRLGFKPVVFNDTLWVIGGTMGMEFFDDVWFSTDGVDWSRAVEHAEFSRRGYHSLTVFRNKLWLIGGVDYRGEQLNDIWHSENGIDWTLATPSANFTERSGHKAIVFNEKFWIIGGSNFDKLFDDHVLLSTNGIQWEVVNVGAPYTYARSHHGAAVFNDKLWITSGVGFYTSADVWNTCDGILWHEVISTAPFGKRVTGDLTVFDNRLWVSGGNQNFENTWSSRDGLNWTKEITEDAIPHQFYSNAIVFNNALWLINAIDSTIWSLTLIQKL